MDRHLKNIKSNIGNGGETHKVWGSAGLTDNHGHQISYNQNRLRGGERGATLLEDFILREKIFHFDQERIPEHIVHARGSAARGTFVCTKAIPKLTRASIFQKNETNVLCWYASQLLPTELTT